MDNLNDDITTEILSHLPMKILLKFRSVSKSWRDIIDSSTLINLHVENTVSNTVVTIDDDTVFLQLMPTPDEHLNGTLLKTIMIPDFPSYNAFLRYNNINRSSISFTGLVHGLICLYKNCSSNPIGLCNPILKEIKILPESPHGSDGNQSRHVGLGYDHVERDLKVVQISPHPQHEESAVVEVYSRKQNKWRQLTSHLHRDIVISEAVQSCSSGGAFAHWHGRDMSPEYWRSGREFSKYLVVSFDMRSEALETIRIPRFENASAKRITVLAREDSLMVFVRSRWYPREVIMWEYKLSGGIGINNYSKSKREDWMKVGCVGPFGGSVWPCTWWKSGGGLVMKVYSWSWKDKHVKIVLYDCCTRQVVRCIRHDMFLRLVEYNSPSFISP